MDYKKDRVEKWQKENILPERNIHFIGVDFSKKYQDNLFSKIQSIKGNKPSFILIEGVLFFLAREEINALFDFFHTVQKKEDYIGSVSYLPRIEKTKAFQNLVTFINDKVFKASDSDFQMIEDTFYTSMQSYALVDRQDYFSLSKIYKNRINQSSELILNENFYVMRKR